jgi:protein gp37
MGKETAIKWTDATFNGWWGCVKISPACANCYAAAFAARTGHAVWGANAPRRFFGDKHWNEPLQWAKKAKAEGARRRVFCSSMADVFEEYEGLDEQRARLWNLIEATPELDWQLLTKRPENIRRMVPTHWLRSPRANVWYGTTVESQEYLDARAVELLSTPAAVHFFSCEPLLGHVDLKGYRPAWIIVGGESGPKHRPLNLDYARSLRDQCREKGIAFFFKQVGGLRPDSGGDLLDGEQFRQMPKAG